jgi:hypothetical protein
MPRKPAKKRTAVADKIAESFCLVAYELRHDLFLCKVSEKMPEPIRSLLGFAFMWLDTFKHMLDRGLEFESGAESRTCGYTYMHAYIHTYKQVMIEQKLLSIIT